MPRDRLQELRRAVEAENAANGDVTVYMGSDQLNTAFDAEEEDKLSDTLDKIETVWMLIYQLHKNIADLKQLHIDIVNSAWTSEKVTAELEEKNREIQLVITVARSKLEELARRVPEERATGYEPVVLRVLRIHCSSLQRAVRDGIVEYNSALMRHQERCAELVRQQMRIVRRSVTNEEFQQELDSGEQKPFTDNILLETLAARQALDDLHARQKELQEVEGSLLELRDMFVNMAVLVEQQVHSLRLLRGEIIDNIENQVRNTKDYVEEAREKVVEAKKMRKRYRKKKRCLICFCVVVVTLIVITVVILLIIYLPGSSGNSAAPTSTTNAVGGS
ncbi:syntaxin-1A-like isoform X2 [Bacillus rossius redtenbacheri]|uniref:syntaxin-1A-like isoform X2 n=1 Tax=Bacillus rossius redtenbacheri TaxID=93214 RepID=UPI002FDEF36D